MSEFKNLGPEAHQVKVNPNSLGMLALRQEEMAYPGFQPDHIAEDRARLRSLGGGLFDLRATAIGNLSLAEMPDDLRTQIVGQPGKSDAVVLEHLSRDQAGAPPLSKRTYLKFAEWRHGKLAERQADFEANRLPVERTFFRKAVEKAAKKWLPPKAIDKLKRIESAQVYLDDGFDTDFKGHPGHALWDAGPDGTSHVVVVSPNASRHTFMHEFAHGLAGKDEGVGVSKFNGGLYRIFGTGEGAVSIEEAVNDHISSSLERGHVEVTNPKSKYRHEHEGYMYEGRLLDTLCTKGIRKISPRLFIDAQLEDSADRDAAGPNSAQTKLVNALHEAFPDHDVKAMLSDPNFKGPLSVANPLNAPYANRRAIARLLFKRKSRR